MPTSRKESNLEFDKIFVLLFYNSHDKKNNKTVPLRQYSGMSSKVVWSKRYSGLNIYSLYAFSWLAYVWSDGPMHFSSWSTSGALLVNLLQLLLIWTESHLWPRPPCDNERRAVRRCTVKANSWPSKNTGASIPSATSQELISRTEYFADLKKSWQTCLFKELQCTLQMLYITVSITSS